MERWLDQVERKVDGSSGEMNQRFGEPRGEMDTRFAALVGEMNARFAEQGGRTTRVEWMMGTLIVRALGVLGRLPFIH